MNVRTLMAMRTQLDALQLQLDGLIEEAQAPQPGCRHERKIDLATMGHPIHWRCRDCGYDHDPQPDGALTTGATEGGDHG